ncbi:GNAT family N-acetyltransferase [Citrobacter amalonaticus]
MLKKETPELEIISGYTVGLIAKITEIHAHYYAEVAGFGQEFESVIAAGLAEFSKRLPNPQNGIWTVRSGEEILGSVAIDSEDLGHQKAHLRWFIIDSCIRGSGYGKKLLDTALRFVDTQSFSETHLWTFSGLNAAKYLYEKRGFLLKDETKGTQWGSEIMEQHFIRHSPKIEVFFS